MQENGTDAGIRSIGRFFLFAIPLVLGLAASVWLGVWIQSHYFQKELSQEDRAAVYTGAQERPKSKVIIQILPHDCTHLTRVDLDGSDLLMYATNDCHAPLDYLAWHWQFVSPDGTVISEGYDNSCPKPRLPGDKAECVPYSGSVKPDDRASVLRAWTQKQP